jgi:hypothetical protein
MRISRRLAALLGAFMLVGAVGASAEVSNGPSRASAATRCTVFTVAVRVTALQPHRSEPVGVTFPGEVRTTKDFCGDEAKVIGERKVCGGFGCNYRKFVESDWKPVEGTSLDLSIEGPCKAGKHRYRTRVIYHAPQPLTPEPGHVSEHQRESDNLDCPG